MSFNPWISGDGRYVTFWSRANNVVPGDENGVNDVFVRGSPDQHHDASERRHEGQRPEPRKFLSVDQCRRPVRRLRSSASDLVPDDSGATKDIYVRDLQTGTNTQVTVDATGGEPNAGTRHTWISGDGRHVVFASRRATSSRGDGNGREDVFVRDLDAGTTTRASVDVGGNDSNGASWRGLMFVPSAISADGRYVEFWSEASDLVPVDGNGSETSSSAIY